MEIPFTILNENKYSFCADFMAETATNRLLFSIKSIFFKLDMP